MSRTSESFLQDILNAIQKVERYIEGFTFHTLIDDEMRLDAVIRNLEIIGEAVNYVPKTIRDQAPEIEWKLIAGLRIILAHVYFGIDTEIIWDIITNELPILKKNVLGLLDKPQKFPPATPKIKKKK